MKSKLCSLVIIPFYNFRRWFLSYKDNEYYFNTNVYYTNSENQIICRYKNNPCYGCSFSKKGRKNRLLKAYYKKYKKNKNKCCTKL